MSKTEAEDIVQLVFLKVLRARTRFRGGNIESWLTRLTRNCALDVLRRRRREALYREYHNSFGVVDVEIEALKRVEAENLRAALSHLEDDRRSMLVASYFEDVSHQSLSQELGLPLGTSKTRIRSSLALLRKNSRIRSLTE